MFNLKVLLPLRRSKLGDSLCAIPELEQTRRQQESCGETPEINLPELKENAHSVQLRPVVALIRLKLFTPSISSLQFGVTKYSA